MSAETEVCIVCDWTQADPFPRFIEAEVGGASVSLPWRDRPDGLKELVVSVRLRGEAAPDSVRDLPAKWRALAEGFRNGTDIGNAEGACLVVSANELEAALSAAPAAPAGNLVAWWNGIRPDTRNDDSSIRWGADSEDSRHDIPLYDGYNPIHYAPRVIPEPMGQPESGPTDYADGWNACRDRMLAAAPAPVAGDAVAKLVEKWRRFAKLNGNALTAKTLWEVADEMEAALAQDRASQAGAAGVPDGYALVPTHWRESLLVSAGLLEAAKCPIDALQAKALRKMADQIDTAPTPAAEREVG